MGEKIDGCPVTITGSFKRGGQKWHTATTKSGWKIMGPECSFQVISDKQAKVNPMELTPSLDEGIKKLKAIFGRH